MFVFAMFHGTLDGETTSSLEYPSIYQTRRGRKKKMRELEIDAFTRGYLLGLLVGEGHFGGDGRQPQITLRMHMRHEKVFLFLKALFPESKLYGPYHHNGRHYYQWMARGRFLREEIWPLVSDYLPILDDHVAGRIRAMAERYRLPLAARESE